MAQLAIQAPLGKRSLLPSVALHQILPHRQPPIPRRSGSVYNTRVSSIDLEMMQSEIEQLSKTLNGIADERDKLGVEIRSTPRVSLLQRAGIGQSKE